MIYENREDRKKQSEAVTVLRRVWDRYKIVETKEVYRCNNDFILYRNQLKAGVGEIKCRDYSIEFFERYPWLIEMERIESLNKLFEREGTPVVFILYTKDKYVLCVSLKKLIEALPILEVAPKSMMKDNHGIQLADKSGVLIPFSMLTLVGSYIAEQ